MPSPTSWNQPWKPPGSIGPSRLCMWLIIFSRNDVAEDQRAERDDHQDDDRLDRAAVVPQPIVERERT